MGHPEPEASRNKRHTQSCIVVKVSQNKGDFTGVKSMKITHERSCDEQIPNAFDTLTL